MPIRQLTIRSGSPDHTERLGKLLGGLLRAGDLICLCGDLGAGKTVFCRGVGTGWGAEDSLTSPTFILAQEHCRAKDDANLIHLDFYRIENGDEAQSLGFDDMLNGDATLLLEWADRIESGLPQACLWIDIAWTGDHSRLLALEATGGRHAQLLSDFADRVNADVTKEAKTHAAGD